jgi:hypothetical protein
MSQDYRMDIFDAVALAVAVRVMNAKRKGVKFRDTVGSRIESAGT